MSVPLSLCAARHIRLDHAGLSVSFCCLWRSWCHYVANLGIVFFVKFQHNFVPKIGNSTCTLVMRMWFEQSMLHRGQKKVSTLTGLPFWTIANGITVLTFILLIPRLQIFEWGRSSSLALLTIASVCRDASVLTAVDQDSWYFSPGPVSKYSEGRSYTTWLYFKIDACSIVLHCIIVWITSLFNLLLWWRVYLGSLPL